MNYEKKLFILIFCFFTFLPLKTGAYELGITPNQVHSLWQNINNTLIELQKASLLPEEKLKLIEAVELEKFKGKKPSDVYQLASQLYDIVAEELSPNVLRKHHNWVNDFDIISGSSPNEPNPSMVYVLSSEILNLLVDSYLAQTLSNKPISQFYHDHQSTDKVPSDVFAQVMLFKKRLQIILPQKVFADLYR